MKRIFKPLAVIVMLLAANLNMASAQDTDKFDILVNYVNEEQNAALTRLQEDIAKAEKLVSVAETQDKANSKFLESTKKGKLKKGEKKSVEAKSMRIKAIKFYQKSYEQLYDIYKAILDEAQFEYQTDKSSADDYMSQAENTLQEATTKVSSYGKLSSKALETTPYSKLKTDLSAAKMKYESAGNSCYQAMKLYAQQADKKNKEDAADQNYWNSTVQTNTIDAYNRYISKFPNGKYVSEARRRITNLQNMASFKRCTSDNPNEGLAYRIQILADQKPWSAKKLQRLYKGNLKIDEQQSDGYYKYWIGCYRSYAEAQQAEASLKLRESFIVCFNEGVQIHVTEAQEIESKLVD